MRTIRMISAGILLCWLVLVPRVVRAGLFAQYRLDAPFNQLMQASGSEEMENVTFSAQAGSIWHFQNTNSSTIIVFDKIVDLPKVNGEIPTSKTSRFIPDQNSARINYPYEVNAAAVPTLKAISSLWSGVKFGALTIPYRLQLSDKVVTAGGSFSGGLGYQFPIGIPLMAVAHAGLSSVQATGDINSKTNNALTGFSYGGGLALNINQSQVSVLLGWDLAGSDYEYSNKPWLSIGIGVNVF